MAAASLLDRSGASFAGALFAIAAGVSRTGVVSTAVDFSIDGFFSLEGFAVVVAFSGAALAVVELFSVVALACVDDFSVDDGFAFVEEVPFVAELVFVVDGVLAAVVAFAAGLSVRGFSLETDAVAESAFGAVSGRTPRAQALATTTSASSGIRA
jgi:hypothetical protein